MITLEKTEELRTLVKEFGSVSYQHYGSFAYSAGWLESTVVMLLANVDKETREMTVDQIKTQIIKLQKELLLKTIKESA